MRSCAAAGGPTISAKTRRTPTICTDCATARAVTTRNSVPTRRGETPRASASSGWSVAKSSGRDRTASAARLTAPRIAQRHQHVRRDGEDVAEQDRRRLERGRAVEAEEQEAEAEREGEHDADGDVAAADSLGEEPHAGAGERA